MKVPLLVIIERVALDSALGNKLRYVFGSPVKNREVLAHLLFLGVHPTNLWLFVSLGSLLALFSAHSYNAVVKHLVFFEIGAAQSAHP